MEIPAHIRLLSVGILFLFCSQAEAFMFMKNTYCSPINGVIELNGKPVPGLTVKRRLTSGGFKGGEYNDQTTTDANGKFHFDAVTNRTFLRPDLLSANPFVGQTLDVNFQNQSVGIWDYMKPDFRYGSEVNDHSGTIELRCDLSKIESSGGVSIIRGQSNEKNINS